jgi:hypothetical protein
MVQARGNVAWCRKAIELRALRVPAWIEVVPVLAPVLVEVSVSVLAPVSV